MKCCQTCLNHLGGGACRINMEAECAKGEYELWEIGRLLMIAEV